MSKTGSAHGSFFGTYLYDQLQRRRPRGPLFFRRGGYFPGQRGCPHGRG